MQTMTCLRIKYYVRIRCMYCDGDGDGDGDGDVPLMRFYFTRTTVLDYSSIRLGLLIDRTYHIG